MYALQKTLLRVKRQGTDCDEIFTDHISKKGLVSQIFKELSKLSTKKTNNLEDTGPANNHTKTCKLKWAAQNATVPTRMAKIKKNNLIVLIAGKEAKQLEPSCIVGRAEKMMDMLWKTACSFLKS